MKRKILAGVLSLCMMVSLFPTAAFAEAIGCECGETHIETCVNYVAPAEETPAEETPAEETSNEVAATSLEETVSEVATYDELVAALAADKEVKLTADITAAGAVDGTDAVIDLNGNTLTLTVGDNNFFGESTIKNGKINITGCVASGDCIIGIGNYSNSATLNLVNVNIMGDGYSSAYAVLYVYNSSTLNINGGSIVVKNDNASAGGVIKAHSAANGKINITGTESDPVELNFENAKIGILDGTVVFDYVDLDIKGGANAINQSALTVKNSTLDITGCDGRALTLSQGNITVENSALNFSDCSEGEIRFKKSLSLTTDANSTINKCTTYADSSATDAKINGKAVEGTEGNKDNVSVNNGETSVINASTVAMIGTTPFTTLQAAINAAGAGTNTIKLVKDCAEDITIKQVEGVNIVIDGDNHKYSGTITIHGNARYTGAETLTITNVNFETSEAGHYFIDSNSTASAERYAHNVTVDNCTFTATGAAVKSAAAMRIRQGFNIVVTESTATGMHSLLQGYGVKGVKVADTTVTGGKNGISVGTSTGVEISNVEIAAEGYGVRADGTGEYDMAVTGSTITANDPIVVRNATGAYELTANNNALTANNAKGYTITFTEGDDGTYVEPTGEYVIDTDEAKAYPNSEYVAKVGTKGYFTFEAALKALTDNATLTLCGDMTITDDWDCRSNGAKITAKSVTIDGNGHTLKLKGKVDDKNWNTVFRFEEEATVKNLTIDASEATGIQRGISSRVSVTVDNCTFIGNGTSARYGVIFGEGAGQAIGNVEASITNSTFTDWSRGLSDNQNGQDAKSVTITNNNFDNSNVQVSAAESVVFTGNEVDNGYVSITSYSQVNALSVTATNNTLDDDFADKNTITAKTINAQDDFTVPVAKIGSKFYFDLHKAMTEAKSGDTVELVNNVDLAGTTWEPVSFAGKFNGNGYTISNLTINKPGVSNTGFIKSLNGKFENVTFTNPTVTGGENTGVVAGRAGGGAAYAKDITVNGTIKVETTHRGYARAGVIVGGWAYGKYENITVDGTDKAVSYIKHTGGGDGRYVAGIVGHADDVDSYINCTVKNITISGGWLCGGIAGPGPSNDTVTGCAVENVNIDADYSGGMFGWYYGAGEIKDGAIKDVTFTGGSTNNGVIGGYSENPSAKIENVVVENVKNSDESVPLNNYVAKIGDKVYITLADAIAAANAGETVTVVNSCTTTDAIVVPNGVTVDLNGKTVTSVADAGEGAFVVNGEATIKNGKIISTNKKVSAVWSNGNLTLADVTIESARHAVRVEGGNAVINGGTYKLIGSGQTQHAVNVSGNGTTVTINGGTFKGAGELISGTSDSGVALNVQTGSTVLVNGGDFSGGKNDTLASKGSLTITGGTFDQNPDAYAANGYKAVNVNGKWTVDTFKKVAYKAPTCTTAGNMEYYEFGDGKYYADVNATRELTDVVLAAKGHSFCGWYTVKDPNCFNAGYEARMCTSCKIAESRPLAATTHNFDINGVCAICGINKTTATVSAPSRTNPNTGVHF